MPRTGGRRGVRTAAATACAAAGGVLIALGLPTTGAVPPPERPPTAPRAASSEGTAHPLPPARPRRLRVPALGLDVVTTPVGLDDDGSVALPDDPDHAGWFTHGPTPGQRGNAVLVGHVDSASGPAAFHGLSAARPGDRVVVDRAHGPGAEFTVTSATVYDREAFPSDEVYGPSTEPRLTLITCAGWDVEQRAYRANLVLTARLTPGTDA
ncbi:sortase domain-containing protein [Streptomyces sp. GSL17-111]|uniref:sortase domain-containing protein n=1 Tax=Streptomyces sp. GSL17-111 TaxID=3121596 RepID=UPI0030F477BE